MSEGTLDTPLHRRAVLFGVATVALGLAVAAWSSWTCDDAFISYRYARNLVTGNGLVFNAGERVEGYTNLLWTLWIALGLRLGAGPEAWSGAFGLASHGATLALLLLFHLDVRRNLEVRAWTLPLACLVCAVHPDFATFATSGLETSTFTCVVLAGYTLLARGLLRGTASPALLGAIFGLSSTLRPDGMVFAAVAGAAVVLGSRRRVRDGALFAVGVGVFWASVTAFRLAYYGDYFPNTYYAKSAYLSWHRQGLVYLYSYLHKYWVLIAGAVAAFGIVLRDRTPASAGPREAERRFLRTHVTLAGAFAVAYTYYVVRVGGDFMYARMLVPVTPYYAILFELALERVALRRRLAYLEVVAAALLLVTLTPRPVTASDWMSGIADERAVYDDARVVDDARKSKILAEFFQGLPVRVAFLGTEARVMYDAGIPVAIEADTGLTDRTIARQPLDRRGRIGHEKRASVPYLVETRAAHFTFAPRAPEDLGLARYIPLRTIRLGDLDGWILHWDPPLMRDLRARGAEFADFGEYLDGYLDSLPRRSREEVARDFERFSRFYFAHAKDDRRREAFERYLARP